MLSFMSVVRHALIALALACTSAAALAGPTYHVTVNTAGLAGPGYLDFSVISTGVGPGAVASVSNLFGDFGAQADRFGMVAGSIPAGFTLTNAAGSNYLTQEVNFGGLFGFDISFAGDYQTVEGIEGATFAVGLFDALFAEYTLAATFAATPGEAAVSAQAFLSSVDIAEVSEVPEPSELALVLTALLAAGAVLRRRRD